MERSKDKMKSQGANNKEYKESLAIITPKGEESSDEHKLSALVAQTVIDAYRQQKDPEALTAKEIEDVTGISQEKINALHQSALEKMSAADPKGRTPEEIDALLTQMK